MSYLKELILLVGSMGSGKSTYCKTIPNYFRVNQDDQGKTKHREIFKEALGKHDLIVCDRMNFDKDQRSRYLVAAKKAGYKTRIIVFNVPFDVCFERIKKREGHPTLGTQTDEKTLRTALGFYFKSFVAPTPDEADVIEEITNADS